MKPGKGYSVRIFMPDGDAEGLRIVEKTNWIGQGLVFPRILFPEIRNREEFTRAGVYILWETGEAENRPEVYFGEADDLGRRFQYQLKKDFWTHAACFTSINTFLNKAHVRYLEARLYQIAVEADRVRLNNAKMPGIPALSVADRTDAEAFLSELLLCLPVVGVRWLKPLHRIQGRSADLVLNAKGIQARGYEGGSDFVVVSGSTAVLTEVPSIHPHLSALRGKLKGEGILEEAGDVLRFTKDHAFGSPSTAAGVVLARSANGLLEWKDTRGRSLREVRVALAKEVG